MFFDHRRTKPASVCNQSCDEGCLKGAFASSHYFAPPRKGRGAFSPLPPLRDASGNGDFICVEQAAIYLRSPRQFADSSCHLAARLAVNQTFKGGGRTWPGARARLLVRAHKRCFLLLVWGCRSSMVLFWIIYVRIYSALDIFLVSITFVG